MLAQPSGRNGLAVAAAAATAALVLTYGSGRARRALAALYVSLRDGDATRAIDGLAANGFRGVSWRNAGDHGLHDGLLAQALPEAARALAPQGFVYLESPRRWLDDELAAIGLALYRYLKAGAVHAHLLQRVKPVA